MITKYARRCALAALAASVTVFLTGCPQDDPCPDCATLVYDGMSRTYLAHFPPQYNGSAKIPLMVVLHGAGGTAESMCELTGFNDIADREGFAVVYPTGIDRQWNDGRGIPLGTYPIVIVDDVGFVLELIDTFIANYAIDTSRIYLVGESNGAMLAHRLAFEATERFAAVATVIGEIPKKVATSEAPSTVLPMLAINSENDPIIPWNGGDIRIAFVYLGTSLSVRDSVSLWVKNNNCDPKPAVTQFPDVDPKDGTRVWREAYGNGDPSTEVVLYRIRGAGHSWPGGLIPQDGLPPNRVCKDINASEEIWKFFKNKSRQ